MTQTLKNQNLKYASMQSCSQLKPNNPIRKEYVSDTELKHNILWFGVCGEYIKTNDKIDIENIKVNCVKCPQLLFSKLLSKGVKPSVKPMMHGCSESNPWP